MIIKWAYAPTFYSLQISTNNVDFKEVVPWRKCAFGETSRKWKESFYWWKWKDRSFLEMINLPEKLSAISIRILMKSPVFSFFGIYEVKVFDRKSVVLIKTTIDNEDYCLLKTKENAVVYDCLDSSSFAFNNDLFKITKDFKIVSPSDKKCLTLKNQKIFFSHCQSSNNQKWELTEKNNFLVLANNSNSNKCLKATTIPIILTLNELNISATSIMNDDQHKAINPFLENNPELCWVSSPGIQEVRYIVRFKEVPIEKIVIKWKYKPKEIRINFSFNEVFWKNVKNLGDFGDNEKVETIFKVDESITGFRIIFLESKELFNDQMVFGIDKIRIITKFKRVEMVDCERKEENQGIEWKIEDLNENFIYENHFQNLKSAHNSLFKKTDNLLKVNKDLSNFNDTLQVFFETSKNIQFKIDKTVNFYIGLNQKISKFKEKNLQNEVKNF